MILGMILKVYKSDHNGRTTGGHMDLLGVSQGSCNLSEDELSFAISSEVVAESIGASLSQ